MTDEPAKTVPTREVDFDFLKSISILGVVFIHVVEVFGNSGLATSVSDLFRFCVPVFVLVWAYFLAQSLASPTAKSSSILIKKGVQLFVPYAVWTIVYFFLFRQYQGFQLSDLLTGYWTGYGFAGQFFFLILLQLLAIFGLCVAIADRTRLFIVIIVSLLWFTLAKYLLIEYPTARAISDRLAIYWIPYAVLGIYIAHREKGAFGRVSVSVVIVCIATIALEHAASRMDGYYTSPYVAPSVFIASFALVSSTLGREFPGMKSFSRLGPYTLGVFVLNPGVIYLVRQAGLRPEAFSNTPTVNLVCCLVLTVIVTIASAVTATAIRRVRLGKWIA